jgi:hypothetical protein
MRYISKGEWFDKGTEVFLYKDTICGPVYDKPGGTATMQVLARGIRNGKEDEELCTMDEFEEIDE